MSGHYICDHCGYDGGEHPEWCRNYRPSKERKMDQSFPEGGLGMTREWRPVETVADLVNNLLTMDQSLPVYGAFHRDRRAFTRAVSVSLERVVGQEILPTRDAPYSAVVWTDTRNIEDCRIATVKVPEGYTNAAEFAADCGFEIVAL